MDTFCDQCGSKCVPTSITTGYGTTNDGRKICFACCGKNDLASLRETGNSQNIPLYLQKRDGRLSVTNWPGTLSLPVFFSRRSVTNWGHERTDVWFLLDDRLWHGYHVGHGSDIVHCKRTKGRRK